jgi:ATP-dependent RNA helicase DeaD
MSSLEPGTEPVTDAFANLGLASPVIKALRDIGYESPSPIQAATIPHLMAGRDVLGQAQTGTGKTAAFALPILSRIDPHLKTPQALVLAPTRELALQVAEAFQKYAAYMPGFQVLPIYGGQSYGPQLAALRRGVQVIVGTPGRVIDHLERGSLRLDDLRCAVLDEADEMLRMGFIDAVEQILQKTPATKQVALFSATMPPQIKRIASTYLKNPEEITIAAKTRTATTVRQRYWLVSGTQKLDALTRMLETEPFEAMIVFARTKLGTEELAEKLAARGFSVAALNGDIPQQQRERTVGRLKDGSVDIVVATDVAARGLDVERISHVVNYDVPTDPESYVHRIGRTGRAGRSGEAILFIAPRERGLLKMIERATRQPIEPMPLPSVEAVNAKRLEKFKQKVADKLAGGNRELDTFRDIIRQIEEEQGAVTLDVAAALALMAQGDKPLLLSQDREAPRFESRERFERRDAGERSFKKPEGKSFSKPSFERPRPSAEARSTTLEGASYPPKPTFAARAERPVFKQPEGESVKPRFQTESYGENRFEPRAERRPEPRADLRTPFEAGETPRPVKTRKPADADMETFRIEVGHAHGVQPKNIVGAIANEADLDSQYIGRIDIRDDHSLVDLPSGMPQEVFQQLKKVWVAGQRLDISRAGDEDKAALKKPFKGKPRRGE